MSDPQCATVSAPWWLWPNVFNLDAPLVAVVWQELLAQEVCVDLSWRHRWLLFLAVWMVYFVDRCLDARIGRLEDTDRHRRHREISGLGWTIQGGVCAVGLILAFQSLNREGWLAAGVVGLATGIWFALTHLNGSGAWWLPKEAGVGVVFAARVALQPWALTTLPGVELLVGGGVLAAVCVQNCASITVWESLPADRGNRRSLLNRWPGWSRHVSRVSLGLAALVATLAMLPLSDRWRGLEICATGSLLALWALGTGRPENRRRETRMLADLALLTPLPVIVA